MPDSQPIHELRHDPLVDRYVLIAESRADRPGAMIIGNGDELFAPSASGSDATNDRDDLCPFCPGNETQTTGTLYLYPEPVAIRPVAGFPTVQDPAPSAPWQVRVVTNKYPAVVPVPEGRVSTESHTVSTALPIGRHEVFIHPARHITRAGELTRDELLAVLLTWKARMLAVRRETDLGYASVFMNVGRLAGASIAHLHSQLVATPEAPPLVRQELQGAERYFAKCGQCYYCQTIQQTLQDRVRLVGQTARFAATCPMAARMPFETWVLPTEHSLHFSDTGLADLADLANLLAEVIDKIERLFHGCAYNLLIHTTPFDNVPIDHYHWHIEIVPRLTIEAGFEWASGCAINTVSPESAASSLRAIPMS
ncbi:MAG: hypothetical protein SGJ20_01685 [Planctomycetota bacterium]|nr:hypothetical protein [Planctomycetota bacterium]